jgi:threonylcarbamoyladenosine tRNA methylthiotransferase MtaB
LDSIKLNGRIRISSIEPNLLTDNIINFVAKSKSFVPHFHIPLQSGNDKILKSMKRRYMSKLYADKIAQIKNLIPHACIGSDVIVGYPGETHDDFLETYKFIKNQEISYLHVFTYSERPNTEASIMSGGVDKQTRHKRSKMLRALSIKKRRAFYESQLGKRFKVLFEGENKGGYIEGFTENYIKVRAPWNPSLVNNFYEVELKKIDEVGYCRFTNLI